MKKSPTVKEYEKALEVVKAYESRQNDLKHLNNTLGVYLENFDQKRFIVNKENKEVTFIGVTEDGELKHEVAKTRGNDIFEPVIGKLICVCKALGDDIDFIEEYIEEYIEEDVRSRLYKDFELALTNALTKKHATQSFTV